MGGGGEARGRASAGAWVGCGTVKITIGFEHKHPPTYSFYGSPLSLTSLGPDRWVRRERYGGPECPIRARKIFNYFRSL